MSETRWRVRAAAVTAFFVLAAAPARGEGPRELVENGSFEKGLAGWTPAPGHEVARGTGVAFSGEACLSGEVTAPNQALILRRRVPVRSGNRYRFEIRARATARTKLVLWVAGPGARGRRRVASWEKVPRKWTRYGAALSAGGDGELELQIVAPSSYSAPAGRIWIDDVSLRETAMPPLTRVSLEEGFDDEPALAVVAGGAVWVARNSFRDGFDSLRLARFAPADNKGLREAGRWTLAGGEGTYLLGPRLVPRAAGGGVTALCARERKGSWDIEVVDCDREGPGRRVWLTGDAAVDVDPEGAYAGETLWVAWESNRSGGRGVWAASLASQKGAEASEPALLSDPARSAYDPSIAHLASGEVCVAWSAFAEGSYDLWLRRRSSAGSWGAPRRLTSAPLIDRHARLAARGDELWISWERAFTDRYYVGRTNRRRLVVARIDADGLQEPVHEGSRSPLQERCEAGALAFDAGGRPWLAFLRPRLPRAGWDLFITRHEGSHWSAPEPLSARKGMDRRPGLAISRGRAWVAFQADDLPNSWSSVDRTPEARSEVFLAALRVPPAGAEAAAPTRLEPLVEPEEPFEPAELRAARGEDSPPASLEYQGRRLRLFFGDLHEHTDISVCNRCGDQSVDESYQHMRDLARHDFACITDHGYNINPYLWSYTAKLARANSDPGRFLAFLAEEWTSSFEKYDEKHPWGYYGHRNLIFSDPYFPRWWNARNGQTPAEVWAELREREADFIHIPHQLADTGNVPTDWDFADESAQPVAEIFQTRGSYEHAGAPREAGRVTPRRGHFLQDAWARGIVIGVIASPDHGGGYGKACVWAPKLDRRAILEAIRQRHCYGTTAAKIVLDVRVDGHLMGEKIAAAPGDRVRVEVRVRAPAPLEQIEVCRSGRFIYSARRDGLEAELSFVDREPPPERAYYYVRVRQADGELAWSSPVWFGAK